MADSDSESKAPAWTRVIEVDRCPTGKGVFVEVAGRELAVFRRDESPLFTVMDNSCPHASGNLSVGDVAGGTVSCPWHHWTFDLETGVCTHSPLARVKVYPSRVSEGILYADMGS